MVVEAYLALDPAAAVFVVLLIDHQSGLISLVQDFSPNEFKNNVLALADVAKFFNLPTISAAYRLAVCDVLDGEPMGLLRLLGSDDDVPGVPVLPPQPELRFPASGFEHALRRVEFAVATHDEAGALGGIHLRAAGGVCTWVATDRYRLATTTCPVSQADWEATLAPALLRQALEDQADGEVLLMPIRDDTISADPDREGA